jgi:SAM-dependent methyltransferase
LPKKENYNFVRYLAAKKSIDDRALNQGIWNQLWSVLPRTEKKRPLRILELGAGIGTMAERMIEWGRLTHADYTSVEIAAAHIAAWRRRMRNWASDKSFALRWDSKDSACIQKANNRFSHRFIQSNIFDFFETADFNARWDLGLAHAFMDLVNLKDAIPRFCARIKPGGFLYLTLNYDGETILLPIVDPHLDKFIIGLYHQSMDERKTDGRKSGDCQTGRHLFDHLKKAHTHILAVGSSDWIVFPGAQGYIPDETYFLHFIIHTIHAELKTHPLLRGHDFEDWIQQRHAQIDSGELIFIAKQLDFLAQIPAQAQ